MRPIFKSIRLDHDILKVYYRTFMLVTYGLAALIAVLTKKTDLVFVVVMAIAAPVAGLNFSLYEKNHLGKLYGILPLSKKAVVVGRYLYALAFGFVNTFAASLLAVIISWAVHSRMSQLQFLTYAFASLVYFCLYIAIQFPIYFKFTFSKVYFLSNVPFYLTVVAADYIFTKDNLHLQLQQTIQDLSAHPTLIWATGLGLGLLLLLVSCPLSIWIHQKSEL